MMMNDYLVRWTFKLGLLLGCGLFFGCEDPFVDPYVPGKHYTIYGYLRAFDMDHAVRIVPVRRSPERIERPTDAHAEIDAVVTSTDLATNTTVRWTHTLQRFDDGSYGHVFSSRFIVRNGRRYRLTVERSDGASSTAETHVPNIREASVLPATVMQDSVSQVLVWPGTGSPEDIEVVYCAKPVGAFSCDPILIDYGRAGNPTEDGWAVTVNLRRDLTFVRRQVGVFEPALLELSNVDMRFTARDEKWVVPPGSFDPEILAQPEALTNVENGFGFWGSVSRSFHTWTPSDEALGALGYVSP